MKESNAAQTDLSQMIVPDDDSTTQHPGRVVSINAGKQPMAPTVIAVTSGKGGVGKTNISVNLAIAPGKQGLRTLAVDADLGLANMDIIVPRLGYNIETFPFPQVGMCINRALKYHCESPILSTAVQKSFGMGFANSTIVLLSCPLLDAPKSVVSTLGSLLGNCNAAAVKLTLCSSATPASARTRGCSRHGRPR